jgi:hypothetical protein
LRKKTTRSRIAVRRNDHKTDPTAIATSPACAQTDEVTPGSSTDAPPATAFRQSLPVLITSLVNKSGSIGLSLLPMLLVEAHVSTARSSLAMLLVKGTTVGATLVSGGAADWLGLRFTVLAAFLAAAAGLALLPLSLVNLGFVAFVAAGMVAQLGITSINATLRLLLTRTVARAHHKEALGWMRLVNNLGQILSYGLASLSAALGAQLLIWFDAATSLAAFVVGRRILPRVPDSAPPPAGPAGPSARRSARGWLPLIGCTLLMTGWNFAYEFFMSGVAGRVKLLYPDEGLRLFALMMMLNTVICAALAVKAARVLTRVVPSLVAGVALSSAGVLVGIGWAGSRPLLFAAMLLLTSGELVYGALGQFLLIRSVPAGRAENTVYSSAILVANLGRMAAAGLAFPLIVDATSPRAGQSIVIGVAIASLAVLLTGRRAFARLAEL